MYNYKVLLKDTNKKNNENKIFSIIINKVIFLYTSYNIAFSFICKKIYKIYKLLFKYIKYLYKYFNILDPNIILIVIKIVLFELFLLFIY